MIEISSTNNPKIKSLLSLKEKKTRNLLSLVLIEGEKVVGEALELGKVKTIVITKEKAEVYKNLKIEIIVVPNFILSKLSSVQENQGVVAVIDTAFVQQFKMNTGDFLVLDGVADPGNLGTIIRSAVAFGFGEIYAINCVDLFNEKVLRSASGTFFKIGYVKTDYGGLEKLAKNKDNFLVCADLDGKVLEKIEIPNDKRVGIILGNEGNGVSREARGFATEIATIPMQSGVESLNVAVSGSILMFNLKNRR